MSDGIKDLAMMFKKRDNIERIGPGIGLVTSITPLVIEFQSLHLGIKEVRSVIPLNNLVLKDSLIIIPSEDEQTYFIVGKEA